MSASLFAGAGPADTAPPRLRLAASPYPERALPRRERRGGMAAWAAAARRPRRAATPAAVVVATLGGRRSPAALLSADDPRPASPRYPPRCTAAPAVRPGRGRRPRRTLGLHPYDVQVMAAAALLEGRMAEMQTGEGKTLSAALAAAVAGLAGRRCT